MNPFRAMRTTCEARLATLTARAAAVAKEIEVAKEAVRLAASAEEAHEKLSPSKPRGAAKPAQPKK